jgi:hypothetical protein
MPKAVDIETRAVMVLQREANRMSDAAERVRLVVQAMALRRGLATGKDRSFEPCEDL